MGAIAPITLNDATPTAVVFSPRRKGPENSLHVKNGYVAANDFVTADCQLTLGISPATSKRPTTHVNATLSFPDPDFDPATATKAIDVARLKVNAIVPDSFVLTSREHFYALCADLLANASLQTAFEDGEGEY